MSFIHKSFTTGGLNIHGDYEDKVIELCDYHGEVAMYIPGFDAECTFITKQNAMDFFGLVEKE